MRKIFLWLGMVILSPFLLVIILFFLLYVPPVQNWVVRKVASVASERIGMDVSVDHVALSFPLDLRVTGFRAVQPNDSLPQVKDTIADVGNLIVNVKLRPLFGNKVVLNTLDLREAKINTAGFIRSARVKARVDRLFLTSKGIDLDKQTVDVTNTMMQGGNIDVVLSDTVPPDTSSTKQLWKIFANRVDVANIGVVVHFPGDTLQVGALLGKASVESLNADLEHGKYTVGNLTLSESSFNYDNNFEPRLKGVDYNHLALTEVALSVDSVSYSPTETKLIVRHCRMKEKGGLRLTDLHGTVGLDSLWLTLPSLTLTTPDSHIKVQAAMPFTMMSETTPGRLKIRVNASLGKQDLLLFGGDVLPKQFARAYPNRPLSLRGSVNGNMRDVDFTGLYISLPTAFELMASGRLHNPTDVERIVADIHLRGKTQRLDFITALMDAEAMSAYRIPAGIIFNGALQANGRMYSADMKVMEGKGKLTGKGTIDTRSMAYKAQLDIDNVDIRHFMPNDSIRTLSAKLRAEGRGFDFLAKSCRMDAEASIVDFRYGCLEIKDVSLKTRLGDGVAHAALQSHNQLLDGSIIFDALVSTKRIDATIETALRKADLRGLRLTTAPITVGGSSHISIASDIRQSHALKGNIDNMTVETQDKTFHPADLSVNLATNRDTTWADVSSGNLALQFRAHGGYEKLLEQGELLMKELASHVKNKVIDHDKIRHYLPIMNVRVESGSENAFANFLKTKGLFFSQLHLNLTSSPSDGLNGDGYIHSAVIDSMHIDTIAFKVVQDSSKTVFHGKVLNNKRNPQLVFRSVFDGELLESGATLNARYYDSNDVLGVSLGVKAEMVDSGISVHLSPYKPLLGYKEFNVNNDNYIFFGRDKRIYAKLDVIADDGTGAKIYSNDENHDMLQDITVSINKFDLSKITSVLPYVPQIDGLLNGDFRIMMSPEEKLSMLSDLTVSDMAYEHSRIGNVGSEFVYLQRDSSSHYVEARMSLDNTEVGLLKGTYVANGGGVLDAKLNLSHTPMAMVNGFIPDKLFGLEGYADGEVSVKGKTDALLVDGEVILDSAYIFSTPYGMHLRLDNDPVRIVGSNLLMENFTLYAHNNNPLNISGNVDFTDFSKMKLALRMRAQNYLLIDSKKTTKSVAYGKAYVNFLGALNGDLDNLDMRGKLDVLSNTDMTYVLKSSPLNTDDQLKGLVTFTNFRDTTTTKTAPVRPPINGLSMQMMVSIESGARMFCALNEDQSNYVNVEGEGELRMSYNSTDDLQMTGRYTMTDGEMKYSLPVIPLKTFHIKNGSYVEFFGDVMNPRLSIEATEEVKASVASDGGGNRTVLFNCGIKVSQTLDNMGLAFTLDAPEDMTIKNELAAMSEEKRGRLAVTMLSTGMYLADGNTGGFSMNSALNSFLQSEINNITNSVMRTTDISLGMDQNSDAAGNTYTDYSFKFAKRFWNNRVNLVIGGKISDGQDVSATSSGEDNTFIDNVSIEYRLDQSAQRYVRLFYNKEAQDLLEDRISEYGAGFVWRKKMDRLSDLFRFGNRTPQIMIPVRNDSTKLKEDKNEKKK